MLSASLVSSEVNKGFQAVSTAGLENLLKPPIAAVNTQPSSGQKNLRKPAIGAAANDPVRSEVRTKTPVSSGTAATQRAVSAQTLDAQNFGTQTGTHVTDAVTGGAGMSSLQPAQQSATPKQGVSTRKPAASQDIHYAVYLAWSGCNYGGQRVAVLFSGKVYACRHCHKLAYQTQREQAYDRAGSRTNTIRKRLGWEAGILNGSGNKSKGMYWRTFERLQSTHDAHVNQALVDMAAKMRILEGQLSDLQINR